MNTSAPVSACWSGNLTKSTCWAILKVFVNSMIGIVENGMLVRTWGIQRDVTERARLEEARKLCRTRAAGIAGRAGPRGSHRDHG